MKINLATLESLGWYPYWDKDGHHPLSSDDVLTFVPSETIKIFWIARPVQEEDGHWYANAIYMYEPFPSLIGGIYRSQDILVDSTVFGEEGERSLIGKIEEFSFWSKDIGTAGVQNYHLNLSGMIGDSIAYKYLSPSNAANDDLKYYYQFSEPKKLFLNFSGDGSSAISSSLLSSSGGKRSSSLVVEDVEGTMKIEAMNFNEEFTIGFRFYMEEHRDFVLFNNPEALKVEYDEGNKVFRVHFRPYIGSESIYQIEVSDFKVHEWYDLSLTYSEGTLSFFINGVLLESFFPQSSVGGYKSTVLDHRNIESVKLLSGSGAGIVNHDGYAVQVSSHRAVTGDEESDIMVDKISEGTFSHEIDGGNNAMNLILDKKNGKTAGLSVNTGHINLPHTITDTIADDRMISFLSLGALYVSRNAISWKILDVQDKNKIKIIGYSVFKSNHLTPTSGILDGNMSSIPNLIIPGAPITLSLKVAGTLSEQSNAFPKLTIFPGTRIKVIKKRMTPPSLSKESLAIDVLSTTEGYTVHGTYAGRQNMYEPKEHGEFLSVEANNSGFHHFFPKSDSTTARPAISSTGYTFSSNYDHSTYAPSRTVGKLKMTRIRNW